MVKKLVKKKVAPKKVIPKKVSSTTKRVKEKAHIFIDSKTYRQIVPHDGRRITSIPPPDKKI